ncbi:MAG TPA: MscL family protein [Marmoricola sp.]|jgi:large conductance mechanosensitive channel
MTGFRNFLLRGNLIEIAVAFIIGAAFGKVVTAFTEWLTGLMPDSAHDVFGTDPQSFGAFLNAVIAFVILAAVVYFGIVVPYTKAKERFFPAEEAGKPADVALLEEIRDLLATRNG